MSRHSLLRSRAFIFCAALFGLVLGFGPAQSRAATTEVSTAAGAPAPSPAVTPPPQPASAPATAGTDAPRGPEQRIALVIGNSRYRYAPELPNPDDDAQSIAQFLNSAGFEVIAATDLTHGDMISVLQDFSTRVAARGPNAVAMIYYAGHGVQIAGENYLIPIDAAIASPSDLNTSAVRLVDIMATLEAIPSRVRIVVLDACRNNPFPTVNDAGRGLAIVDAPNGSIVGYSTAPGTEALDGSGNHSPYTAAFLKVAREPDMPIEQVFKRIRVEVNQTTNGEQTPWESSSLTSDFYFFGNTAVAANRAPGQARITQVASNNLPGRSVRQAYDYVLTQNSPEFYQEFIEMYPHDPLCERVRGLLANLLMASAWHKAVVTNTPLAYKSFADSYGNSPYAQTALKLQVQPKVIPVLQPTKLIVSQQVASTLKLGGTMQQAPTPVSLPHGGSLPMPNGNGGVAGNLPQMPGNVIKPNVPQMPANGGVGSLPQPGTPATLPATGGTVIGKPGSLPSNTGVAGHLQQLPGNATKPATPQVPGAGNVVTLPPQGTTTPPPTTGGTVIGKPGSLPSNTGVAGHLQQLPGNATKPATPQVPGAGNVVTLPPRGNVVTPAPAGGRILNGPAGGKPGAPEIKSTGPSNRIVDPSFSRRSTFRDQASPLKLNGGPQQSRPQFNAMPTRGGMASPSPKSSFAMGRGSLMR